jgi:hypothetical protein
VSIFRKMLTASLLSPQLRKLASHLVLGHAIVWQDVVLRKDATPQRRRHLGVLPRKKEVPGKTPSAPLKL